MCAKSNARNWDMVDFPNSSKSFVHLSRTMTAVSLVISLFALAHITQPRLIPSLWSCNLHRYCVRLLARFSVCFAPSLPLSATMSSLGGQSAATLLIACAAVCLPARSRRCAVACSQSACVHRSDFRATESDWAPHCCRPTWRDDAALRLCLLCLACARCVCCVLQE